MTFFRAATSRLLPRFKMSSRLPGNSLVFFDTKFISSDLTRMSFQAYNPEPFTKLAIQENGVHDVLPDNELYQSGELLKKVYDVTLREKLVTGVDELSKVVDFKQPQELLELMKLQVSHSGCASVEEVDDILEKTVQYSTRTQHPYFYNQLYGSIDEISLASAWLVEALNTNQHTFEVAPVFVMVEHYMISLLTRMFGYEDGDGIFAPGGSVSNMYGIALARHHCCPDVKKAGVYGRSPMVIFTSDQSHYSLEKGAIWMGIGLDNVIKVATDSRGCMIPSALKEAIHSVKLEGKRPFFVNATAGSTVFGSFDPFEEIAEICQEEGLWMHVDACWGGTVILSKAHRHLLKGIERCDSIAWNPHKMLCTPLQCSVFLVRHKGLLQETNCLRASYLFQQDKCYDVSYDTGDKSIQCGRKADVFKLWFMMRVHGLDELEQRVDAAFEASRYLEAQIAARPGFRLVLDHHQCTNVCFWYIPPSLQEQIENEQWWEKLSKVAPAIKSRMVQNGTIMIGYQPIGNKGLVNFFRMVNTCHPTPTAAHMDFVLSEIERYGKDL